VIARLFIYFSLEENWLGVKHPQTAVHYTNQWDLIRGAFSEIRCTSHVGKSGVGDRQKNIQWLLFLVVLWGQSMFKVVATRPVGPPKIASSRTLNACGWLSAHLISRGVHLPTSFRGCAWLGKDTNCSPDLGAVCDSEQTSRNSESRWEHSLHPSILINMTIP
jgi:hypothetical protein